MCGHVMPIVAGVDLVGVGWSHRVPGADGSYYATRLSVSAVW
jgi:hypothetical protein